MAYALTTGYPQATACGFALKLDGTRIVAQAGAIALNGAVLLLLLAPMAAPRVMPTPTIEVPITWVVREKLKEEPIKVQVKNKTTQSVTKPVDKPQPIVEPLTVTVDPQPFDFETTEPFAKVTETVGTVTGPSTITPPLQGAYLEYITAPPPPYPHEAVRDGVTGEVLLQILVDIDGKPLEVTIKRSSGSRVLDQAARRQVLTRWKFKPAMRDGLAVQALGLVPVEFALNQ